MVEVPARVVPDVWTIESNSCSSTRPWLVTSERILGRLAFGRLAEWRWSRILGCQVDLTPGDEVASVDTCDGAVTEWRGPGVAPLAVIAIARLYGPRALLNHPGLAYLRATGHASTVPSDQQAGTTPAHDYGRPGAAPAQPALYSAVERRNTRHEEWRRIPQRRYHQPALSTPSRRHDRSAPTMRTCLPPDRQTTSPRTGRQSPKSTPLPVPPPTANAPSAASPYTITASSTSTTTPAAAPNTAGRLQGGLRPAFSARSMRRRRPDHRRHIGEGRWGAPRTDCP